MKFISSLLTVTLFTLVFAAPIMATGLLTEDFNYLGGTYLTNIGWTAVSSAGTNAITVSETGGQTGLSYNSYTGSNIGLSVTLSTSGEDDSKLLSDSVTSGSIYAEMMVNVASAQPTGGYFFCMGSGTSTYYTRLFVRSSGNGYQFGISKYNETAQYESTVRSVGTTYLVVIKYTFNPGTADDQASLFINPALSGGEPSDPTLVSTNSADINKFNAIYLRQGTSSTAPALTVDGIKVSTTWQDFIPDNSPYLYAEPNGNINLSYIIGEGPSQSVSYILNGVNLINYPGVISVVAPVNFEISTDNSNFANSISLDYTSESLAPTLIYLRLVKDLSPAAYGPVNLTLSGGGATLNISCTGFVLDHILTVTPPSSTDFSYLTGTGPSATFIYTVSGANLSGYPGDITVTAPANYELTIDSVSWGSSKTIPFITNNFNAARVSVRLVGGLSPASYGPGNLSFTGGGASPQIFTLNGFVHALGLQMSEDFDYSASTNITGQGGWVAHSLAGTNPVQVVSPGLSYLGYIGSDMGNAIKMIGSGEDINHHFTRITSGAVYVSAMVNVSASLSPTGDYFLHLSDGSSSNYYARTFIAASGSGFIFGLSKVNGLKTWTSAVYNFNQTYLIVLKYNFIDGELNDYCDLYINPPLDGNEPAANLTTDALLTDASCISTILLRQGGTVSSPSLIIDGIMVSTTWNDLPMPVELSTFVSNVKGRNVNLNWVTQTEKNSNIFLVERKTLISDWQSIGSVKAAVLSNSPKQYLYSDKNLNTGKYQYRLKMIDNDGSFEFSKIIESDVSAPNNFELSQNYPNPFNPSTKINYKLPFDSRVSLEVYNLNGERICQLVNNVQSAGYYSVDFNLSSINKNISSGVYFYRIIVSDKVSGTNLSSIKKMILMK